MDMDTLQLQRWDQYLNIWKQKANCEDVLINQALMECLQMKNDKRQEPQYLFTCVHQELISIHWTSAIPTVIHPQ